MQWRTGLLFAVLSVGCVTSPQSASEDVLEAPSDPLVIALLDSGANPYLPIFATSKDLPVYPGAQAITLSRHGTVAENLAADASIWSSLAPETLYHFEGTRVLGIGFDVGRSSPHVLDAERHGSATSYFAARDAPAAIIVMVQANGSLVAETNWIHESFADSMEWMAAQDWIDVISVSAGVTGNPPTSAKDDPVAARFFEASRQAAQAGKLVIIGSGNSATPPLPSFFAGPPWVVAVGGVEEYAHGSEPFASKVVDIVANMSDYGPADMEGNMDYRSGTSHATPIVAGTIADALARVRAVEPSRVVTPREVRDALNATAVVWGPTDWDPTPPDRNNTLLDTLFWSSYPILTQAQMGWGYVNASLAPEIARRILEQDFSIPAGKEQAAAFQPRYQQAREEYWARFPPP